VAQSVQQHTNFCNKILLVQTTYGSADGFGDRAVKVKEFAACRKKSAFQGQGLISPEIARIDKGHQHR